MSVTCDLFGQSFVCRQAGQNLKMMKRQEEEGKAEEGRGFERTKGRVRKEECAMQELIQKDCQL